MNAKKCPSFSKKEITCHTKNQENTNLNLRISIDAKITQNLELPNDFKAVMTKMLQ